MMVKSIVPIMLFLTAILLIVQAFGGDEHKATQQKCQLISANPPDFKPLQFIPKKIDFTKINRFPKVESYVNEDGSVSDVKILKETGSPEVDAGLVKSIKKWKYKPQPGCTFKLTMDINIEIGLSPSD
jgi:TonB family protein